MYAEQFYDAVQRHLQTIRATQMDAIARAGAIVAASIAGGGRIWMAQTTHCLHGEATYRAGGLMAVHILDDPIVIDPGDVVIEGTPAGTSGLAIDVAMAAKARGATLIALTQLVYERDPRIVLQHASRLRLHELADVVIDLAGSYGDGEIEAIEPDLRILPASGITGMMAMWMIFAEAIERLLGEGKTPLIWQSMLVPGAQDRNERLRSAYRAGRIGYLSGDSPIGG
jgi:uncharacterized phosphosugar-binding protein